MFLFLIYFLMGTVNTVYDTCGFYFSLSLSLSFSPCRSLSLSLSARSKFFGEKYTLRRDTLSFKSRLVRWLVGWLQGDFEDIMSSFAIPLPPPSSKARPTAWMVGVF